MAIQRAKRVVVSDEEEARRRHLQAQVKLRGKNGFYPLNAPGMPPPGPSFLRAAQAMNDGSVFKHDAKKGDTYLPGDKLTELYRRALREPHFTMAVDFTGGEPRDASFVPGHIWGQHIDSYMANAYDDDVPLIPVDGPHPAEVMVIAKMPGLTEIKDGRNLIGPTGELFCNTLMNLHVAGFNQWYITNLVKFYPPDGSTVLKAGWIADCLPILHEELRIVQPKYILCLGADASKALLGKKFNVSYMEGRVIEHEYPVHASSSDDPEMHKCLVMTVLHPAAVLKAQGEGQGRTFERSMGRAALLVSGQRFDLEETDLDHRVCESLTQAEEWVEEVNHLFAAKAPHERLIAIDLEWEGLHPMNQGAHICTVQMSWEPKHAICFHLRDETGASVFKDADGKTAEKRLAKLLTKFMEDKRAVGHFLVSDLEWAEYFGFHFLPSFEVPLTDDEDGTPAWQRLMNGEGGLDTAAMLHAIEETSPLGLEFATMRYTTVPRYDHLIEDAVKELCKTLGIKRAALEGYGKIDRKILIPYANYDADGTLRLCLALLPYLDKDYQGNNCWEPFWETMAALPPILDMHRNGFMVDKDRIDRLTELFCRAKVAKEEEVKQRALWPEFNIRSVQQVKEFLFGARFNGKSGPGNTFVRLRPGPGKHFLPGTLPASLNDWPPTNRAAFMEYGARTLSLKPLIDTSKPPKRWEDIASRKEERQHSASTNKQVLSILAQENPPAADDVNSLRDYRFLDQVTKSVLRPPVLDEDGEWLREDDDGGDGFYVYDSGLAHCIDDDGRVRTHIYPTAETGRCKHARPNLANISKTRDNDYTRLLGNEPGIVGPDGKPVPRYKHKLRSIFVSAPGFVGLEGDLKGAELYMMAIMAGDLAMIAHCQRNQLDEDHPNYYDIHSAVACMAFKLTCPPTKAGLKSIGKTWLRNIAKTVIFGIAYGRGAKAIAFAAKEQGVNISVAEAQLLIDTIFQMYPRLTDFFNEAAYRVKVGWMCHCFGRFRRVPPVIDDFQREGEFERVLKNFPIQGGIASMLDRGTAYLRMAIREADLTEDIRVLLTIHDAIILETRPHLVGYSAQLMRWAMCDQNPVYPSDLGGEPITDRGPYMLDMDFEVFEHWGESMTKERRTELGVPLHVDGRSTA